MNRNLPKFYQDRDGIGKQYRKSFLVHFFQENFAKIRIHGNC